MCDINKAETEVKLSYYFIGHFSRFKEVPDGFMYYAAQISVRQQAFLIRMVKGLQ